MCSHVRNHDDASSSGDDLWGSDDGSPQGELERERDARHNQFHNVGYRDGLDAGKEKTLQHGFDIGFKEGAQAGFQWGALRAAVKTLEMLCGQVPGTSQLQGQASSLASTVDGIQPRLAMLGALKQVLERPMTQEPPREGSATGISEQELCQAFDRLAASTSQGSVAAGQKSSSTSAAGGPVALPDMAAVIKQIQEQLVHMGFGMQAVALQAPPTQVPSPTS
mmetsp:Transcript_7470/g.18519  ORF Transcript_7470/g.18519 Transcript_7470/m.18519 type:complete len:222 (-) Transcript_7470:97-762(-)|eukprot:CAMPEP_0202866566 /NCGR_PEP_ID=MMETSP1391-20130828/7989_1 /ASSEMBLY_ACC=CAM_ASM_000867 /TAXON_ID=1034604 /ORGANISM="Chlamydomonas leiostraca, Strain SAG 11-49" /LENGTH=221 /DNA_ID=CAMNT_0049546529 /DNA_START=93 /DNA_END=758 /DNA_ORIENTATION=-